MSDLFTLTKSLMSIPSVSGEEEPIGFYLRDHLESLDWSVELQKVSENQNNVIATLNDTPRVWLSTHMDTVPPFIPPTEDADKIYGRGSCDAKGIIAAQIKAAESLREDGVNDIGLLFTVDEERASTGAKAANLHPLAAKCEYMINGEPTDNDLAIGSKGTFRVKLTTTGKAAHSAYPEEGESAIEKLLDILDDIRDTRFPNDDFFGETTVNIGTIEGGIALNVIPPRAEAGLATTDIPHMPNWGKPLLLGPGSILVAHTKDEFVRKEDLEQAAVLYHNLVLKLLG